MKELFSRFLFFLSSYFTILSPLLLFCTPRQTTCIFLPFEHRHQTTLAPHSGLPFTHQCSAQRSISFFIPPFLPSGVAGRLLSLSTLRLIYCLLNTGNCQELLFCFPSELLYIDRNSISTCSLCVICLSKIKSKKKNHH